MLLQAPPAHQRSPRRGPLLRQPLRVLSGNTPTHRHGLAAAVGSGQGNRRGNDKPPHLRPPAAPCCRDDQEEAWSVVRPGYVREKIAMFTSPPRGSEGPGGGLKVKGDWEGEGETRYAKRARRSRGGELPTGRWEEPEEAVSVGEMVAFLEQRASEQQMTSVPLLSLQRSSASITLTRPAPSPAPSPGCGSEVSVEAVRVWDLVARLESECVKSPSGPGRRLLRGVGRVLLAGTRSPSSSSSLFSSPPSSPSSPSSPQPPSPPAWPDAGCPPGSRTAAQTEARTPGQTEVQRPRGSPRDPAEPQTPSCGEEEEEEEKEVEEEEEEEPPPGKLFFSQSPVQRTSPRNPGGPADGGSGSSQAPPPASPRLPSPDSCGALEERRSSPGGGEPPPGASQDFLEARFKLQLLLEPRPPLLLLPQHLLLHILSLLPTRSLAALKCSCRHFSSLIEEYGVQPVDSRWVADPRYRDDPCKQCKRRYRRGDVSLCRWHRKPYCQVLPYGPGFWMCCHAVRRDSPGCNAGLHDNRWVPDGHSFTPPVYRRREGPADHAHQTHGSR